MKRWQVLGALLLLVLSTFQVRSVYAANIGFTGYEFSAENIYQGDSNLHVDLEIINNDNTSITVHGGLVHFDWQLATESFSVGSQRSGEPWDLGKLLAPAEAFVMRIPFSVPLSVSEGEHAFYFRVFFNNTLEAQWNPRAQDPFASLDVRSSFEPLYNALVSTVEDKVAQAGGAGFISPEALSLLNRARSYVDEAYSYATQAKWQTAVSRLQSASSLADQSQTAEQRFRIYLIIGAVVAVGVAIGLILFYRKRKKQSLKTPTEKPEEKSRVKVLES